MFKLPKGWVIFLSFLLVVQPLILMSRVKPLYAAGSVSDSFADETKIDGANSSDYAVSGGSVEMGAGNYFGDGSDGAAHFTTNTSFSNTQDGDYVVKEYSSLTIDSGVTVTTANRGKGLFIYVSGDATINGTLSMTHRGAYVNPVDAGVASTGLRLPMYKSGSSSTLSSADFSGAGTTIQNVVANQPGISGDGKIYQINRTGAAGTLYGSGKESSGFDGTNGSVGQTAGGGTGAYSGDSSHKTGTGGDGADGTCFSGGSGGGAGANLNYNGEDAFPYGGPGGRGYGYHQGGGGGGGNPGGVAGSYQDHWADPGEDGTGGVVWLVVGGNLTIGSGGTIEANGADGGDAQSAGGGGSGGGIIYALYAGSLSNTGTVQATGGIGGAAGWNGGDGGDGYTLVESVDAPVTSSIVQSTNLLSGVSNVSDVTSFVYNLSSKPAGTGATIQFSQNGTNWYNSAGSLGGTDTLSTGTDNSIDLSGLGWGGSNFYYKVNLTSDDGIVTPTLDDVTVDYLQAPTAPTIGTATALSTSSIRWNFTDNASNETGFRVFDTGNTQQAQCSTANISYCDETGLLTNTSYTRKVAAYNGDGNSSYSGTASKYTLTGTPSISLGTPTVSSMPLTAGNTSNLGSGSSGVYFDCTDAGCDGGINGWLQSSSDTATGLAANTSYAFRVKARNGNGVETSYSSSSSKYTAIEVPVLSVSSVGSNSIDLSVSGVSNLGSGSSGVYFDCTSASCDSGLNSWLQTTSDSSTGLIPNTQYSFQVKARNGDGVETSYSSGVSQYTLAVSPGGPSVSNAQATSLDVSLDKSTNPAGTEMALYKEEGSSCDGVGGSYVAADGSDNGATEVWQDEASWGTTTVTGLSEMTEYSFCAKAKNADATETGWSGVGTASTIESDPPSITSIDSVAGDTSSAYYDTSDDGSTVISFTSSDGSGGGVSACKWDSSDVAYDSMSNSCTSSSSCDVNLSGEGDKTVYIRCSDVYGNKMSSSEQVDFTIDATAPSGLSVANSSSDWVKDKPSVMVSTPTDSASGILELRYSWDNTLGADCSGGTLTSSGADLTGSLSEGSHRLYMCVKDNAGNVSSWDGEYKWDNGNPTVNISTHTLTAYKASNIPSKVEGAASDAVSGLSSVAISIYNQSLYWSGAAFDSASRVWLAVTGTDNWEYSFSPDSDGTFTLRSRSTDSAGNTQESGDVEFIYDTVEPSIEIDESTEVSTASATITWTTDEDASTQVEYGTNTSYGNVTSESDTGTRVLGHSQALSSLQSCTTYHYRVKGNDEAGNQLVGSDKTFTTTGCVGDAEVESESEGTVSKDTGGEVELKEEEQTKVKLTVPVNFSDSDADFQVKKINKDKALLSTSTPDTTKEAVGDHVYQFDALKSTTEKVESFSEAITITMSYTDEEISGKDESGLEIYRWDGSAWNELDDCNVNTVTNQISCTTTNFSVFALFGEASISSGGSSESVVRGACEGLAPGNKAAWIYGSEVKEDEIKLFFTDGDKPIDKYLLVYGESPGEYLYGVEDIGGHNGGWNTYTVKGLEEGKEYYFKIVGKNACKFGPWSNEFRASTLKTGSSLVSLTGEGSYEDKETKNELKVDKKDESEDKKVKDKVEFEPELKRDSKGAIEVGEGGIISKGLRIIVGWWESLTENFRGIVKY